MPWQALPWLRFEKDSGMLRILLIDDTPRKIGRLKSALIEAGFEVIDESGLTIDLPERVEAIRPDVVLIDTDSPGRDVLEQVVLVSRDQPRPIVMFTDDSDPTPCVRPFAPGSVPISSKASVPSASPILDVAMARFESDQQYVRNCRPGSSSWSNASASKLAKGMLMKMRNCKEEEAYTLMRRQAMSRQQKLIQSPSRSSR